MGTADGNLPAKNPSGSIRRRTPLGPLFAAIVVIVLLGTILNLYTTLSGLARGLIVGVGGLFVLGVSFLLSRRTTPPGGGGAWN